MQGEWWKDVKQQVFGHLKAVGIFDHSHRRLFRSIPGHRMHSQTDLSYPNWDLAGSRYRSSQIPIWIWLVPDTARDPEDSKLDFRPCVWHVPFISIIRSSTLDPDSIVGETPDSIFAGELQEPRG